MDGWAFVGAGCVGEDLVVGLETELGAEEEFFAFGFEVGLHGTAGCGAGLVEGQVVVA